MVVVQGQEVFLKACLQLQYSVRVGISLILGVICLMQGIFIYWIWLSFHSGQ
jgi:hypothetical protein